MILNGIKVLITAGGTREYIDDARVITNISTGALGAKIAKKFYEAGCIVHYIHAKQAVMPIIEEDNLNPGELITHQIVTVKDLMRTMKTIIIAYQIDIVIHSAAVSDFTFRKDKSVKLSSNDEKGFIEYLSQTITPTPKIIQMIKKWNPATYLVGFKFTVGKSHIELAKTAKEFGIKNNCDLMVANDKEIMKRVGDHVAYFVYPSKELTRNPYIGKDDIARGLVDNFKTLVSGKKV